MKRFNLVTSVLSALTAVALVPVWIAVPKVEWVLASIALGLFAVIQFVKIRKFELRQPGEQEVSNK